MKIFYFLSILFITSTVYSQNFNGQWKGNFVETSYGFSGIDDNVDYVLELEINGSKVSGYSYTYFNAGKKRYYTICKLRGSLDKSTKDIVVTEFERVKYNTPPDFQNCFQTHKLHYVQDSADVETLRGTWMPAPDQTGNCGYGTTFLSRRIVKQLAIGKKPVEIKKDSNTKNLIAAKPAKVPNKSYSKPPAEKSTAEAAPPVIKNQAPMKDMPAQIPDLNKNEQVGKKTTVYEPRRKDIIKTIPITQPTFKVDFYDNGVVDGDSITVFYNGKIVLSHKMLTTNPISLTLALDENVKENIITMYADNLGSIPPNTALMIVTDGDKRYEVRIESDTEKSGSVVFVHNPK